MITEAFSYAVYPGDDALVPHVDRDLERQGIMEFFKGKPWEDLSLQSIDSGYPGEGSACLFFMTDEAARDYLPAYMSISLDDFEEAEFFADAVVRVLTPQIASKEAFVQFVAWAEYFTQAQREVISQYLLYMTENHADDFQVEGAPDIALKRFWRKFLL
ncbi:MAG: hypothetical protein DIZ78_09505 [endosymbiont of Escarpia spicata]|uniref:Uncharacterized protein n=1 Tax=endosymbiont of Escarpia spicata TaxID=2200908 RepID=A0A370DNB2_9GAMM|nr:MAG: hypothetical protein DIZ78_09505 [endosymbiont of Escarpia spicata]